MRQLCDKDELIALFDAENVDTEIIENSPMVDAVEVVRCRDCIFSGDCNRERSFKLMKQENPFCCVGMRK